MQIIMGGSGSTGSSLLKNILNRNPDLFAGGETAFFAKKMIYEDWKKARGRVLKRRISGLRNHGWHLYNGTDLLQPEYLWEADELERLLINSNSLQDFSSDFYERGLQRNEASHWLEKTPANAACFSFFLRSFQGSKAIHMVRNPFDTIASLMSRGFDLHYAVGVYLLNTSSGLSATQSERVYSVHYEQLISDPEKTVRGVCAFLGLDFSYRMLEPQGEKVKNPKLEGWNYDETKKIEKGAVGRFNKLREEEQDAILEAVNMISISNRGKAYYDCKFQTIQEVCEELGYDFYPIGKRSTYKDLVRLQRKDRIMRLRRGYPTGIYYPLEIRK